MTNEGITATTLNEGRRIRLFGVIAEAQRVYASDPIGTVIGFKTTGNPRDIGEYDRLLMPQDCEHMGLRFPINGAYGNLCAACGATL